MATSQAPTKPTILFIPGFWEGPAVFSTVSNLLSSTHGYKTATCTIPSTGQTSPNNGSLADDAAAVHAFITPFVEDENGLVHDVVLVCHSAGGLTGTEGMKGLSRTERAKEGKAGGVVKIVFLTAGVFPLGFVTGPLPFFEFDEAHTKLYCVNPTTSLFNDCTPEVTAEWLPRMQHQPATGWDGPIVHAGWRDVESVFLVCGRDGCVPAAIQRQCAQVAGSVVEECDAGHMVILSRPELVVECVRKAAGRRYDGALDYGGERLWRVVENKR